MTQSNTEELKNARSATTGEKFDSLDERIDCEVDRINKKIDVTMLQQEDKENHVIENTVEGMTTDMVIKGRTLINLIPSLNDINWKIQRDSNAVVDSTSITMRKVDGNTYSDCYTNISTLFKTSTKYTIIIEIENNNNVDYLNCNAYGGNLFSDPKIQLNKKSGVFTILKTTASNFANKNQEIQFQFYGTISSENNASCKIVNLMILEGDWTNKPIPNYFEGIKSFGQQEDKISILSNGSNLLYNIFSVGSCSNNGNDFVKNSNKANFNENKFEYVGVVEKFTRKAVIFKHKFKPNENYTLNITSSSVGSESIWGWFLDDNLKVVSGQEPFYLKSTSGSSTILSKQSYNYFMITFSTTLYNTNLEFYNEMILTESNTVKNFKPPIFNKKDILLSSLGFDEGLRGLNLTVCDKLNDIKNVAIKRVEKHSFTGNENISLHDTQTETVSFRYLNDTHITSWDNPSNLLCTSLPSIGNKIYESNNVGCASDNAGFIFRLNKNSLTSQDVEGFKKWLKENPTTIYYELAEPVETPLDESIALKTFGEKTYVGFENAISGTSSFKAPVNTVDTIARLNRENRALEEENKTLRQDFESTTLSLTDSDLELVKQNVDMDFRLMEVEFALDIPQAILSSNIKFKNKKGEVKSMARTPYEMMKIVILSGDYDREDYIHKVGKYYERGRMTKEEHDELMSLMIADEVISK